MKINPRVKSWKYFVFGSISIIVLAIFLRVYNLLSIPIFVDEAIYVRWAQIMRVETTLRFLPLSDGKQPLFMWIMIPFLKIFNDPLIAGRLVSVCSGMASLIGIYFLTYELFKSKKTALIASFFYAISPFTVFFDRLSLVDSLLSSFGIWMFYFSIRSIKELRLDFALIAGFFLGFAWLTKSPAVFFLILLPFTFVFLKRENKSIFIDKNFWRFCFYILITATLGYLIFNILRLGPNFHLISLRNKDYLFSIKDVLQNPVIQFIRYGKNIIEWFVLLLPLPITLFSFWAFIKGFKKYSREYFFLSLWFFMPLLVQIEFGRVLTARYFLFILAPLFIVSAVYISNLLKLRPFHFLAILSVLIIPALVIDFLFLTNPQKALLPQEERAGYLEAWTSGYGISQVADFIKNKHLENPEEHIVVGTEGSFGTLPNGLQIYLEDLTNVTVLGTGDANINTFPTSLFVAKKAGDTVYLVVNKSRLLRPSKDFGLQLIKEYPKAIKKDGTFDSLQLFEVGKEAIDLYNLEHVPNNRSNPS